MEDGAAEFVLGQGAVKRGGAELHWIGGLQRLARDRVGRQQAGFDQGFQQIAATQHEPVAPLARTPRHTAHGGKRLFVLGIAAVLEQPNARPEQFQRGVIAVNPRRVRADTPDRAADGVGADIESKAHIHGRLQAEPDVVTAA